MKLAEIKTILAGNPTEEQLAELKKDERAGVQKLLAAYDKKREKEKQERQRFANMLNYEKEYMALPGIQYIVGGARWPARWSSLGSFCRRTCLSPA